jgi:hypothetical protein
MVRVRVGFCSIIDKDVINLCYYFSCKICPLDGEKVERLLGGKGGRAKGGKREMARGGKCGEGLMVGERGKY